ncbi:tetratricopeptide repeat protein [Desulfolutivibrio sulfoxidireducens]|uniref:tetratricopeptide repeat protein n=1 Tax=Desulfolutivibrio sulfoxidireducens TaxID=2773299 RepID=UPI00159E7CC9|nr:tetratricopeptide repeat protein [Desulfolutivibrio sulfoxidireducens]QLA14648.1 tetratricopeptide repeat protein [Desulfolutivibrio sulfoxidireducens]QLA18229.1 tetratricopeptide repeat protein [Desulfolutivibrio sulfoxidireducens]
MRAFLTAALFAAVVLIAACGQPGDPAPAILHDARTAYITGENLTAEELYQRYLQEFPQGENRLEAWNRLYDIAVNLRKDMRKAVPIVDAMLLEYASDPAVFPEVVERAAGLHGALREWDIAAGLWTRYIQLPGITGAHRSQARIQLAKCLTLDKKAEQALAVLRECGQSGEESGVIFQCRIEEAGILLRMDQFDAAKTKLQDLLSSSDVDSGRRAQAGFLLGETFEALQLKAEAIRTYESILADYPNPQAVKARLEYLRK